MHAVDGKLFEAMVMGYGENDERFARAALGAPMSVALPAGAK